MFVFWIFKANPQPFSTSDSISTPTPRAIVCETRNAGFPRWGLEKLFRRPCAIHRRSALQCISDMKIYPRFSTTQPGPTKQQIAVRIMIISHFLGKICIIIATQKKTLYEKCSNEL